MQLLKTPTDILRYLWYEKTGYVQIIEPKTLVAHARKLYSHMWGPLDKGVDAAREMKQKLMLKYDRKACLRVAKWLNGIPMTARQAAENMNPKRGMWVRIIRALRLELPGGAGEFLLQILAQAALCAAEVQDLKMNTPMPLLVVIPDRHGTSDMTAAISRYLAETVGIHI